MADHLSSLPPFPEASRDRLPPPRRDWGKLLWPASAFAGVAGLLLLLRFAAGRRLPVYLASPEAMLATVIFVGLCGLLLAAVLAERRGRD
jgi:hypothetical protein